MPMASQRSSFGKDTGLQARMLLTMFLLGLVYVVFVGVLFAAGAGAGLIVIVAVVLLLVQLFTSDKLAMATMGVKEVSPEEEPQLHGIIERLCVQADLPKPRVCVMESAMPNAFAMGRSKKSTSVTATRGILELLSPAELEGVMAHELTHVINRDVMVMTLASFFATLASMIIQFSFFFGGGFGGGYGRDRDEEEALMRDPLGLRTRVRDLLLVVARAVALSRVRSRPRLSRVDGAPQRAGLGAVEDQRHDRAGAEPGSAQGGRDERFLHHSRTHEEVADEHLCRPPPARAAPGGARAPGVPASEQQLTVGLRDILTGRHEVKGPAPDRLFAISTAYIALQSEHGIDPTGTAAIVFQALATAEFEATLREMEEVVKATGGENGTTVSTQDDSFGYRWMVLRNPTGTPSIEDLAVGINAVSGSIETAGHGERLLVRRVRVQ